MQLTIKNDGGQSVLILDIIKQEDAEEWLYANVKFKYKNFSANFTICFMLNDLYPFRDELVKLHSFLIGTANLNTIEDNINLKFTGDGLGHITVNGILRHASDCDLQLHFEIDSDQTFLTSLLNECNEIIEKRGSE